ncbi:PBP1A family penicillin-binding protein [Anaerosporobacter faecicola]|uniref:PBP1A family penicillin-binding protein n=1 Tax=Anaerosporobacter faecicola TaxID=2718714 RepID=UPI00143C0E95|nr:PBP1A family penicillin-binding protein [Anaerosporobacter faecicola]
MRAASESRTSAGSNTGNGQSNQSNAKKPQKSKKQLKREKAIRFKKQHPVRYHLKLGLKIMFLVMLIVALVLILLFYNKYGKKILRMQAEAKKFVSESTLDTFRASETSLVYDVEGDVISELKGEKDVYYLDYQDIPQEVIDAFITIEDKNFLKHKGVDLKANLRAVLVLIKNRGKIKQGASTITQQLSRNIFLTHTVSWDRKIEEIFIATELEKKYEKWQILEFYINNIYFANGYYGIQAASEGYFSKEVKDLTLSEIAFLCAIPNNPTVFDPIDNYDNTISRRNKIIKQMWEDGKISQEEYQEAYDQEITLKLKKIKKKDYVETYVNYCATRAIMQANGFVFRYEFESEEDEEDYNERYNNMYSDCQQSLYREGYRIYTSINMDQQKLLQNSVDEALEKFTEVTEDGVYKLQGSAVCIDNQTGYVTAIVGGRKQKSNGYTLNRAFQSYRQPGSSIKPLIVYTPILENGHYPEETVVDEKFKDGPSNSNGVYSGKITLRKAVEQSKNTIAWKLFEEITPKVGLRYLKRMNFAKIDKNDYYPAASLGGFTNGVSAVEMASAYATIENDGIYREPTCIVKITDAEGAVIISGERSDYQVYDKNAARMMTNILTGVVKYGTGKGLSIPNMDTAGKTGTTNEKKDGWFVGYTPYYTTSVWVGYDMPKKLDGLMGSTYPGQIWYDYMTQIHEGLEKATFPAYKDTSPKKEEGEAQIDNSEVEDEIIDDQGGMVEEEETDTQHQTPDDSDVIHGGEQDTTPEDDSGNTDIPEEDDGVVDDGGEEPLPDEEDDGLVPDDGDNPVDEPEEDTGNTENGGQVP